MEQANRCSNDLQQKDKTNNRADKSIHHSCLSVHHQPLLPHLRRERITLIILKISPDFPKKKETNSHQPSSNVLITAPLYSFFKVIFS